MKQKVSILISKESDRSIMQQAEEILKEYAIPFETVLIANEGLEEQVRSIAKTASVIIAGSRGNFNFTSSIANLVHIPVVGVPMRSDKDDNDLAFIFAPLQQPSDIPIATVALDSGHNAGILAVQILATADAALMQKMIDFKENLKNKILKADVELSKISFEYRTN